MGATSFVKVTGFTDGGHLWNGRIYDPKSGKSYKSKLNRNPDGTLTVQGCVAKRTLTSRSNFRAVT